MDPALLAGSDSDGLSVLDEADGVGLSIFESDESDLEVYPGLIGQLFVFGDDIGQEAVIYLAVVVSLLEGDAEYVLVLLLGAEVVRIDLYDIVPAVLFLTQYLKSFVSVSGSDYAIGYFIFDIGRGSRITGVAERRPVAIGAETV